VDYVFSFAFPANMDGHLHIKIKNLTGKDFEEEEEWGYADKRKEDLGMF
jgi:hypothetical protein